MRMSMFWIHLTNKFHSNKISNIFFNKQSSGEKDRCLEIFSIPSFLFMGTFCGIYLKFLTLSPSLASCLDTICVMGEVSADRSCTAQPCARSNRDTMRSSCCLEKQEKERDVETEKMRCRNRKSEMQKQKNLGVGTENVMQKQKK